MSENLGIAVVSPEAQLDMLAANLLILLDNNVEPAVTLVMCVSDPVRVKFVQRAVNTFFTVPIHKSLSRLWDIVIVNASGKPALNQLAPGAYEYMVDSINYSNLASMRNYGIAQASGQLVMPVDDDDYSDPARLLLQAAALLCAKHKYPNSHVCSMLTTQTLVDVEGRVIGINHNPQGIPGTAMFQRWSGFDGNTVSPLYSTMINGHGEDVEFVMRNFDLSKSAIIDNVDNPLLHVCFWHGRNMKTRQDFMGQYADIAQYQGLCPPSVLKDKEIFESILLSRGLSLVTK